MFLTSQIYFLKHILLRLEIEEIMLSKKKLWMCSHMHLNLFLKCVFWHCESEKGINRLITFHVQNYINSTMPPFKYSLIMMKKWYNDSQYNISVNNIAKFNQTTFWVDIAFLKATRDPHWPSKEQCFSNASFIVNHLRGNISVIITKDFLVTLSIKTLLLH